MTDPDQSLILPAPQDDGAADHLPGTRLPAVTLPATDGRAIDLAALSRRSALFVYPGIGGPGGDNLLDEWTAIPGARGCTPEACAIRDALSDFRFHGVDVFGLSGQTSAEQAAHVRQLALSFPLLSDERLRLADELRLPTFEFRGRRYYTRLTLIVTDAVIESALYPVFPAEQAADQVLGWLGEHPPPGSPSTW
jgi:peroxiredoxin